jgi:hypothetical protein
MRGEEARGTGGRLKATPQLSSARTTINAVRATLELPLSAPRTFRWQYYGTALKAVVIFPIPEVSACPIPTVVSVP